MSSGQKRAYEDEQEEAYNAQIARLKKLKPEEMLKRLDTIRDMIRDFGKINVQLTRGQHMTVERAEEAIDWFYK